MVVEPVGSDISCFATARIWGSWRAARFPSGDPARALTDCPVMQAYLHSIVFVLSGFLQDGTLTNKPEFLRAQKRNNTKGGPIAKERVIRQNNQNTDLVELNGLMKTE